ncbi:MAG: cyclophilin-like fold protein [Nitrososphaera sp.]|jgi:hypothetical protein
MASVEPPQGSVSRIRVEIEVRGRGIIQAELARHLAPLTCSALLKSMPVEGRIHRFSDSFLYAESGLIIGAEKQRSKFKRGDLAYMTSNGAVCMFVKDASIMQSLNPIGYLRTNIEILDSVQAGDVAVIKKAS